MEIIRCTLEIKKTGRLQWPICHTWVWYWKIATYRKLKIKTIA